MATRSVRGLLFDDVEGDGLLGRDLDLEAIEIAGRFLGLFRLDQLPAGAHGLLDDDGAFLGGPVLDGVGARLAHLVAQVVVVHLEVHLGAGPGLDVRLDLDGLVDGVAQQTLLVGLQIEDCACRRHRQPSSKTAMGPWLSGWPDEFFRAQAQQRELRMRGRVVNADLGAGDGLIDDRQHRGFLTGQRDLFNVVLIVIAQLVGGGDRSDAFLEVDAADGGADAFALVLVPPLLGEAGLQLFEGEPIGVCILVAVEAIKVLERILGRVLHHRVAKGVRVLAGYRRELDLWVHGLAVAVQTPLAVGC